MSSSMLVLRGHTTPTSADVADTDKGAMLTALALSVTLDVLSSAAIPNGQ